MRSKYTLLKRGFNNPTSVPPYVLGKLFPDSGWGSVVEFRDEFVTFRKGGFVQGAKERPAFCARLGCDALALRRVVSEVAGDVDAALEVGCGYGRLTPWIADLAHETTSIDPNEDAVATARELYPSVDFEVGLAQELSSPDDAYDLIVTWNTLQHVPPDGIGAVAAEFRRVLAPDGTLVAAEQTASLERDNAWGRSETEYDRLFGPLELVESRPKPVEPTFDVAGDPSTDERTDRPAHPHERLLTFVDSGGETDTGDRRW
jgi:SAM-dependent methyltransferase